MRSLVVTTWYPSVDAPSRTPFCLEHVLAVQSAGHDVHVVHVRLGGGNREVARENYQGTSVTRVAADPRRPWSLFRATWVIRAELRRSDVLHTMAFSTVLVTWTAWLLARRPWVHTEHWNGVIDPGSVSPTWRRLAFVRHVLRLPHRVTGVTTELAVAMKPYARRGATQVVPCVVHPVDTPAPYPPRPPLELVGVGLLIDRKRPLLAIHTIAWLHERGVDVRYTWVGDGPLRVDALALAERLGIGDRVSLPGAVAPELVSTYLQRAHLFFLPSSQENFFTAVAEAISAGRPAVVPLSGGFDDYCSEQNSVLVHSWEIPDLGEAIRAASAKFVDTPPTQIADTLHRRFSREVVGSQFDALYREVAS